MLTCDESSAAGCTTLLTIIMEKANTFIGDPVDVWRFIAHQSVTVSADVGGANIITPKNEDVWFLLRKTIDAQQKKNGSNKVFDHKLTINVIRNKKEYTYWCN